jgi:hypothetical protein
MASNAAHHTTGLTHLARKLRPSRRQVVTEIATEVVATLLGLPLPCHLLLGAVAHVLLGVLEE